MMIEFCRRMENHPRSMARSSSAWLGSVWRSRMNCISEAICSGVMKGGSILVRAALIHGFFFVEAMPLVMVLLKPDFAVEPPAQSPDEVELVEIIEVALASGEGGGLIREEAVFKAGL